MQSSRALLEHLHLVEDALLLGVEVEVVGDLSNSHNLGLHAALERARGSHTTDHHVLALLIPHIHSRWLSLWRGVRAQDTGVRLTYRCLLTLDQGAQGLEVDALGVPGATCKPDNVITRARQWTT